MAESSPAISKECLDTSTTSPTESSLPTAAMTSRPPNPNAHEWTDRYPAVVAAMNHLPVRSCLIDGEVVACNENGLAIFDLLRHGPRCKSDALLVAFDLLELK
jgi:hypothetical protein